MSNTPIHIVGMPTPTVWSIATHFPQEECSLSIALTVTVTEGDAATMGRTILSSLQRWIESRPTFEEAVNYFSSYTVVAGIEIVLWFSQKKRSLFCAKDGVVGVERKGSYFTILSSNGEVRCVQGSVQDGDVLIFGTSRFRTMCLPQLQTGSAFVQAEKLTSSGQAQHDSRISGQICVIGEKKQDVELHSEGMLATVTSTTPLFSRKKKSTLPSNLLFLWIRISAQRKKALGALMVLLLVVGGFFFLQRLSLTNRQRRIEAVTKPLQYRYTQISESTASRVEKERQLAELVSDTSIALKNNESDLATTRELTLFSEKLEETYLLTSKQKKYSHLPIFYDFRLITADFVGSVIQYDSPGKLAVFADTARGKVVSLSLEKKQPQSLSISADLGAIQSVSIVDRKAYLLGTKGIYEVSLPLDTPGKGVAIASPEWKTPKLIGSFAKNIYVFDSEARQVWRYDRDDFLASPSAWLRGKEGIEMNAITSLAIDGDIWMGTLQGEIYKFTRGDRNPFRYSDILQVPETAIYIYTAQFLERLYILEPRAQRILIVDKSGAYVSSVISPDLQSATSLIVDETGKKAYVLAGSLVYEVEL